MRALLLVLFGAAASHAAPAEGITFLHISDIHVSNYTGAHPQLREWRDRQGVTVAHLRDFVQDTIRQQHAGFVVASGDLIDAWCYDGPTPHTEVYGQIELFRSLIVNSPAPFYPGLGNHDIECYRYKEGATAALGDQSVKAETRKAWQQKLAAFRQGTYYSFRQTVGNTGYLFLILDDGEADRTADESYRATQMTWIKSEAASHPTDYLIFVMHIPLGKGHFAQALRETMSSNGRVVLALAGHNHKDGLDEIPFGDHPLRQVRTAALESGADHWRAIRLLEDHIEITATGDPDRTLLTIPLPPAQH